MLDEFDELCQLTHPEKKIGDDGAAKGPAALSAVTNGAQEGGPDTVVVEAS